MNNPLTYTDPTGNCWGRFRNAPGCEVLRNSIGAVAGLVVDTGKAVADDPLTKVGAVAVVGLVANDVTGVGLGDDVLIPLVVAGTIVVVVAKNPDVRADLAELINEFPSVLLKKHLDAGDKEGAQDKKLTDGEIKNLKAKEVDPHELKEGYGPGRDLFKKPNGDIVVKPKDGSGPGEPTGYNINDF